MEIAREIVSAVGSEFPGIYLITPFLHFDSTCEISPICARDVTRRWSGALEQNKTRRLGSAFRQSRCDRHCGRVVALFSGAGNSGRDSAAGDGLGSLERDLLPDPLRLL